MLEMFLWAVLIGGLPTAGYYLFQYGRKLYARGRELRETGTDPEEAGQQWWAELRFILGCCAWASSGLVVCRLLETASAT
ncbi:hypothetical protein [Hymenobacter sp. YC55]|uniref:hypothetical protein n=1 Tax=Hymenobacter sp. YC55 TaxID=3034019 RepID=UPI0023F6403C|nr:hypothetical protein [Hymenobacter sp. YC55]MDF7815264.1 hypothetical protein [Hymenobacter sp. YC55]